MPSRSPRTRAALAMLTATAALLMGCTTPAPQPGKEPIIVLGTALFPGVVYAPLVLALQAEGYPTEFVDLPDAGTGTFAGQAAAIDAAVNRIRQESGAARVSIVGNSSGAVAARYWMKAFGGAGKVRTLVSLGAAHHGADATTLYNQVIPDICAANPACIELVIGSDFMKELNEGDETPGDARYVSIATRPDPFVPEWSTQLDGAANATVQDWCPGTEASHFVMHLDEQVFIGILQALEGEALDFGCTGRPPLPLPPAP